MRHRTWSDNTRRLAAVLPHGDGPWIWLGTKRPPANTALTTAVDARVNPGHRDTLNALFGLFRRLVVDSCGLAHSPERRKLCSSGSSGSSEPPGLQSGLQFAAVRPGSRGFAYTT
jgi:hypothetical protein